MGMDQELASLYGTPGNATQEDQSKVAEAEIFAKLAADQGIDLSKYTDEQIQQLWDGTFGTKTASEEETCPECKKAMHSGKCAEDKTAEKTAAAAKVEFDQMQEWKEKAAECDKLGRIMAHAYVQELGLIDQAMKKQAEFPPGFMPGGGKKDDGDKDDKKPEAKDKDEKKDDKKEEEKKASAIDDLAAKQALEIAKVAGLDPEVVAKRIDAVMTLGGVGPSEKVASVKTLEEVVHIRALEHLEKAGYQIDWNA